MTPRTKLSTSLGAALGATLLSACGGGGGGSPAPLTPVGNLESATVQVLSTNPASAHEMELRTTITSDAEIADVPVGYYLLYKEDVDNEVEDIRQFAVDSTVFEQVRAGTDSYTSTIKLPEQLDPAGEYYLVAEVDPNNVVPETDEEDNYSEDGDDIVVIIDGSKSELADVVVEDMVIDEKSLMMLNKDSYKDLNGVLDHDNHDFGATLTITVTGPEREQMVDISGDITVPGQPGPVALLFWDSELESYEPFVLAPVAPGIPNSVHVDVLVPLPNIGRGNVSKGVLSRGPLSTINRAGITIRVNERNLIQEWEEGAKRSRQDDNQMSAMMPLIPQPAPPKDEINWDSNFVKKWNNKVFNLGLALNAGASLDERGAIASGHVGLPVKLFGKERDMLSFDAFAQVKPVKDAPTESQFNLDVKVLGQTLYSRSAEDVNYTYEKVWSVSRTVKVKSKVFVGPVPIDVIAGATAEVGFRATAYIDPGLMRLTAGPFADASAFAEASINAVIAKGGVRGSLTLISEEFVTAAQADLSQPSGTELQGTVTFDVSNHLQGPKGRIWLFLDRKVPKWCKKFGVKYPCGLRTKTKTKTLVRFNTFQKTDVLFRAEDSAIVDLTL